MAFVLTLTIFRNTRFFTQPRFWAEEGTLHFAFSYSHNWLQALFQPQIGYLNFWANLSTVLASLVPLETAPLVTTCMALVVQMLPIALILWSRSIWLSWPRKILIILIYHFVPLTEEVWLNSVTSYTYWIVITFIILLDSEPLELARKWIYRMLLIFCGLSSPSAGFLLPFFFYSSVVEKKRERIIQTAILAFSTFIQLAQVLLYRSSADFSGRFHMLGIRTFGIIIWPQTIGLFSLGVNTIEPWARDFYELAVKQPAIFSSQGLFITGLMALFCTLILLNLPNNRLRILYGGSFIILSILTMMFSAIEDKYSLFLTGLHQRIFFAPNIIFAWMSVCAVNFVKPNSWHAIYRNIISALATVLLTTALIWGVIQYWNNWTAEGPWFNWRQEIQTWQMDPDYHLRIQPDGWTVTLKN